MHDDKSGYFNLFVDGLNNLDNIDKVIESACSYVIDHKLEYQINDIIHYQFKMLYDI